MDAAFDRAGSERSVHAEAFAGRAEQRQEEDRQGVEQQQTVAPLRIADAQDAQAHAETQILGVAEPRLDRPPGRRIAGRDCRRRLVLVASRPVAVVTGGPAEVECQHFGNELIANILERLPIDEQDANSVRGGPERRSSQ